MTEIIVAALALLGTAIGSLTGVLAANRLTNYRIEQLEKKVDKHNTVIERVYAAESEIALVHEKTEGLEARISGVEKAAAG